MRQATTQPWLANNREAIAACNDVDSLNRRVVTPMTPVIKSATHYRQHLCPPNEIKHKKFALLTHQMTGVPLHFLENSEGSLSSNRDDFVATTDFLVTGI